ncbi:MAG: phage terminase large subunit family protein, partial [Thermoplasmata archaeon]|nr:phage terminase large subunit family protein [Thermoplasmata archaeon]
MTVPDPYLLMSEWAEKEFILPQESTAEYGKIRLDRTPMIREPLDELSPMSPTSEVVVVKPTQFAGTTIGLILMFCTIDLYPGPGLFITVNESLAKRFSKKRIDPGIRLMPS